MCVCVSWCPVSGTVARRERRVRTESPVRTEPHWSFRYCFNQDSTAQSSTGGYTQGQKGGRYYTFQLISSLFVGCAEKYLPMSAINGMRIVLCCENVKGAFVTNGLYSGVNADAANSITRVVISDSTFFMNMVRVDPTVDAQLIKSAQSPDNWNISIHYQTYQTFQMSILANQAMSYLSK